MGHPASENAPRGGVGGMSLAKCGRRSRNMPLMLRLDITGDLSAALLEGCRAQWEERKQGQGWIPFGEVWL